MDASWRERVYIFHTIIRAGHAQINGVISFRMSPEKDRSHHSQRRERSRNNSAAKWHYLFKAFILSRGVTIIWQPRIIENVQPFSTSSLSCPWRRITPNPQISTIYETNIFIFTPSSSAFDKVRQVRQYHLFYSSSRCLPQLALQISPWRHGGPLRAKERRMPHSGPASYLLVGKVLPCLPRMHYLHW